jgi:hypothetical protein
MKLTPLLLLPLLVSLNARAAVTLEQACRALNLPVEKNQCSSSQGPEIRVLGSGNLRADLFIKGSPDKAREEAITPVRQIAAALAVSMPDVFIAAMREAKLDERIAMQVGEWKLSWQATAVSVDFRMRPLLLKTDSVLSRCRGASCRGEERWIDPQ